MKSWVSRAAIAAALLNCATMSGALAETGTPWLTDPDTNCRVFNANAGAGDSVRWSGGCSDGLASGQGTATFISGNAETESFTGTFDAGVVRDGHVAMRWGEGLGWRYDGDTAGGQFNGHGILVNDKRDRFEGDWTGGKLNGRGTLIRADGEIYDGEWKNGRPDGTGLLTRADGSIAEGLFADGKLVDEKKQAAAEPKPAEKSATPRGFERVAGKSLSGIDGSRIALTLIEGGIERQITAAGGAAQKTTFTFMNERLGTVVEDGGPSAGANVTGFFRLTDNGVDVRYADGRGEILSTSDDGGVLLSMTAADGEPSCRSWYPEDHVFSEAEKKAALAAYASKLGLAAAAEPGCATAPAKVADIKPLPRPVPAPVALKSRGKIAALQPVAVRESVVHAIDAPLPAAALDAPVRIASLPGARAENRAAHCLKVESDGLTWGFRNACDFAVQFAYCLQKGGASLTDCGPEGQTRSVAGSVAANGFGALTADKSFSGQDADHNFRWIACDGGAGEVVAHLESAEPPSGRCERSRAVTASK